MYQLTDMEEDAFTSAWERWVEETPSILKTTGIQYTKKNPIFASRDDYLTANEDSYYKEQKVTLDTDLDELKAALREEWADEVDQDLIMSTSSEGIYEISRNIFDKYCGKYMDKQLDDYNAEEMEIC